MGNLSTFLWRHYWLMLLLLPQCLQLEAATIELTVNESAWLAAHHTVRTRVSDYPPYMFKEPKLAGISIDYLNHIANRFGFKVEFLPDTMGFAAAFQDVGGPCQYYDLLLTFTRTPEREQQFAITSDYLTAPWVLYARQDSPYIIGLESLGGKIVAGEKGFAITNQLKVDYPSINILEVATSVDALMAVATGAADAYIGNLANASFLIKENRLSNLLVAAPTPYGINTQAMAVRKDWPELASLINKGLAAMMLEERNVISQKWGTVEMRSQMNYTLAWQILVVSTLIFLAFFRWNRRLAQEITVRQRIESELRHSKAHLHAESQQLLQAKMQLQCEQASLQALNESLEVRVAERTREVSEALGFNETILRHSPVPMVVYAANGQCVNANEASAKFVGATIEELLAQNFNHIYSWQSTTLLKDCHAALAHRRPQHGETHFVSSFGKEAWFEYRILPAKLKGDDHLLIQLFDLTERKRIEEELRHFAFHDALTRLPNRRLLLDRLIQALHASQRDNSYLAVLFLDLNKFKQLNDTYGHDIGDQMLIEVACRLRQTVRHSDTVARNGGDEFIVLLEDLGAQIDKANGYAMLVADKIRSILSDEFIFGAIRHIGSASIGIKLAIGDAEDPDQIIKEADAAMYAFKKRGVR